MKQVVLPAPDVLHLATIQLARASDATYPQTGTTPPDRCRRSTRVRSFCAERQERTSSESRYSGTNPSVTELATTQASTHMPLSRFVLLALLLAIAPTGVSAKVLHICHPTNPFFGEACQFSSIGTALRAANDGDHILVGPGIYEEATVVANNDLTITAVGGAHLRGRTVQDKAALVITGNDIRIHGLECSGIWIPEGNGACIRHEGRNLSLVDIYFHDSQQGILTCSGCGGTGTLFISNSTFERLGGDLKIPRRAGLAHAIYYSGQGGKLVVQGSRILSTKEEGTGIKSRAAETLIERTTVASLEGEDSRLIDLSNGGVATIVDSILSQGPNSTNSELIAFGLEGLAYDENKLEILGNTVMSLRESARLYNSVVEPTLAGNKLGDRRLKQSGKLTRK